MKMERIFILQKKTYEENLQLTTYWVLRIGFYKKENTNPNMPGTSSNLFCLSKEISYFLKNVTKHFTMT